MYAGSIDDVLEDMEKDEQGYYVEADTDHSRFIYHIDENIDGILQAKMLLDDHDIGCPDRNHGNRGSKLECQRKDRELPYGADCR